MKTEIFAQAWCVSSIIFAVMAEKSFQPPLPRSAGTPPQVPPSFDCGVRRAAWEYGKETLPSRGEFRTLFDALQLEECGENPPTTHDEWSPPTFATPPGAIFVDASASAGGDGSKLHPFSSLASAVEAANGKSGATIVLRTGTYHEKQIQFNAMHSGLTIQNFEGEHAIVSGAVSLGAAGKWTRVNVSHGNAHWTKFENLNNVFARVPNPNGNTSDVKFLGTYATAEACQEAVDASTIQFLSFTWNSPLFNSPPSYASHCYGTISNFWSPHAENNVVSGKFSQSPRNIWSLDLTPIAELSDVLGLRLNGGHGRTLIF